MGIPANLLVLLAFTGIWLSLAATLPLHPCFLVEGAAAPTDVEEVRAAAEGLMTAAAAWFAAGLTAMFAPSRPVTVFSCALVALSAGRAWEVILIVAAWAGHVRGDLAVHYWIGLALPCAVFFFGLITTGAMAMLGARKVASASSSSVL